MEFWAVVKRLLEAAQPGQTFSPALVMGSYLREIEQRPADLGITREELDQEAEGIAEQLKAIGLIREYPREPGPTAMLGRMMRTEFGDELYSWLRRENVVMAFEGMMVALEKGAIRQMLYQLDS